MRKIYCLLLCFCCSNNINAQQNIIGSATDEVIDFKIKNSEEVITNDMIFMPPYSFKKNRQPLILVNGKKVATLTYFIKEEIKSITVLQPKEGLTKFGQRGKNGVIITELKETATTPEVVVTTNKIYYKCNINGKFTTTSIEYYDSVRGKNCYTLDLRDTSAIPVLYANFDNEIKIKNLGVGWDMTMISIAGATFSGTANKRIINTKKTGQVKLTITTCQAINNCNNKIITFNVIALPKSE